MAEAFCLEVDCWESELSEITPVNEPSGKRRSKLSLSLKRKATVAERFEFVDDAKSEALSKKFVPKNTKKSTQWALSTLFSWRDKRNVCFSGLPENQVPPDILISTDPVALYKWLTFFIAEVRKRDGTEYPTHVLHYYVTS